jgi:hypothetical protein
LLLEHELSYRTDGFEANGVLIALLQNKYELQDRACSMPPFWPFKRSKHNDDIDEAPPAPIVYRKEQEVHTEKHANSLERDENAYKDALALFGGGDTTVKASKNVAEHYDGVTDQPLTSGEPEVTKRFEWIHHTDGYHYKKMENGQFEPTPFVKNEDGSYSPYA